MRLEKPGLKYQNSFLLALKEHWEEGKYRQYYNQFRGKTIEEILEIFQKQDDERDQETWWLVSKEEYLGRIVIKKNDNRAGDIAADIPPSKRGKGLGKEILRLGLERMRALGYREVRLECRVSNLASKRVIEFNGGKLRGEKIITGRESRLVYIVKLKDGNKDKRTEVELERHFKSGRI
jgi:predicted acetyltransferase